MVATGWGRRSEEVAMAIRISISTLKPERLEAIKTRFKKARASVDDSQKGVLLVSGFTDQIIVIANDEKLKWLDDLND